MNAANDHIENIETKLLLEAVFQQYGFDFRNYALASLKRRIRQSVRAEKVSSISALQEKLLYDSEDGAAGLAAIKRHGGLTIAQQPETAEYGGMPHAAVATGMVDQVLALDRIVPFLTRRPD